MNREDPQPPQDRQDGTAPAAPRSATGLRRRILLVLAAMVVFAAVAIPLVNYLERDDTPEIVTYPDAKSEWESVDESDYDYDIMQDKDYLSLNRVVMYENPTQNFATSLDDSNRGDYGEAVTVLDSMIRYLIQGDADRYNRLFTSAYLGKNGEQARFTMQQLYDIRIIRGDSEQVTENGKSVTYQKFYVEYKIRRNNGTYRRDIGDDESRRQVVVLCNRDDGKMLIDQMYFPRYKA